MRPVLFLPSQVASVDKNNPRPADILETVVPVKPTEQGSRCGRGRGKGGERAGERAEVAKPEVGAGAKVRKHMMKRSRKRRNMMITMRMEMMLGRLRKVGQERERQLRLRHQRRRQRQQ